MKKAIAFITVVVLALSLLAACGGNAPAKTDAASDASSVKTIGEALALADEGSEQYSLYDNYFVCVFEKDGKSIRLTAALTGEQSDALWALDVVDDDYETKLRELVSGLAVIKSEDLSALKLRDDELQALIGKTGGDLIDDGWTSGSGCNLYEMEFYLEYPPYSYVVKFESDEPIEDADIEDELEAIRPLKIVSVRFDGLGQSATDLPEEFAY